MESPKYLPYLFLYEKTFHGFAFACLNFAFCYIDDMPTTLASVEEHEKQLSLK